MKLTGSCNKRSSSPSSPVTADTDTVTTSSKKSMVAGLFSSEDDDSNKNQQQIIINKLEDENKALKNKNKTLEAAAVVSSTVATAATATVLTSTESSTILAPFVLSVLRDQTLADLLQAIQQLNGLLENRNNQIATNEATQELEEIRLQDLIANIRDNARDVAAVVEALR